MSTVFKKKISTKEWLFFSLLIALAAYLLTPRGWEPGADTLKIWFASRLLVENFEFPLFSHGPLYVLYLCFFRLFEYPISFFVEYSFTHFFCYLSIYILIRQRLNSVLSFFLLMGWIPFLSTVEGTHVHFGMGFISLYLRNLYNAYQKKKEWFPITLSCAALSHPVYSLFLIGHILGVAILKFFHNESETLLNFVPNEKIWKKIIIGTKSILLILTILTILLPSKHPIYNHLGGMEIDYVPVSTKGFSTAFFQIGLHKEILRTTPKSELIYQDWYITKEKIYGDAENFIEAAINNPKVFFRNIAENILDFIPLSRQFIGGYNWSPPFGLIWSISSYLLFILGFIHLTRIAIIKNNMEYIISILFGTFGHISILFLTWFNQRYSIVILPFALMLVSHIPSGMKITWQKFNNLRISNIKNSVDSLKLENKTKKIGVIVIFMLSMMAILIISILWESIPRRVISHLIFCGILFLISELIILFFLFRKPRYVKVFFSEWFVQKDVKSHPLLKNGFILAVIFILIWNAPRPFEAKWLNSHASIGNWINGRFLLQGEVSMSHAYPDLMKGLDRKNTRILTHTDTMAALGIYELRLDGIHTVFKFPPFEDNSGRIESFLNSLDEIWVNKYSVIPTYHVSTQAYLRYKLHLQPFLKKNVGKGWVRKKIKNFGFRYIKIKSDENI